MDPTQCIFARPLDFSSRSRKPNGGGATLEYANPPRRISMKCAGAPFDKLSARDWLDLRKSSLTSWPLNYIGQQVLRYLIAYEIGFKVQVHVHPEYHPSTAPMRLMRTTVAHDEATCLLRKIFSLCGNLSIINLISRSQDEVKKQLTRGSYTKSS